MLDIQIGFSQMSLVGILGTLFVVYLFIRSLFQQKPRVRFKVCLSIFVLYSLIQFLALFELLVSGYGLVPLFMMMSFYAILILDPFWQAYRLQRDGYEWTAARSEEKPPTIYNFESDPP